MIIERHTFLIRINTESTKKLLIVWTETLTKNFQIIKYENRLIVNAIFKRKYVN